MNNCMHTCMYLGHSKLDLSVKSNTEVYRGKYCYLVSEALYTGIPTCILFIMTNLVD